MLSAMQMGFSITRVQEDGSDNTFAYILRVPFEDQLVLKKVSLLLTSRFSRLRGLDQIGVKLIFCYLSLSVHYRGPFRVLFGS